MPKIARDLTFLMLNTILLAIIAFSVVNNVRVVKSEISQHRHRNEAENLCQIEVVVQPLGNPGKATTPQDWVKLYKDCVDRRSGEKSPNIKASNK